MKKSYDKIINQHYHDVARKYKTSKLSTMNDEYVRNQETNFVFNILEKNRKNLKILDVGCGNGYTLFQISKSSKNMCYMAWKIIFLCIKFH